MAQEWNYYISNFSDEILFNNLIDKILIECKSKKIRDFVEQNRWKLFFRLASWKRQGFSIMAINAIEESHLETTFINANLELFGPLKDLPNDKETIKKFLDDTATCGPESTPGENFGDPE